VKFFKLKVSDVIVLQDEKDLPLGKVRKSFGSSAAGHNGIKSVSESLGSVDYDRIRIGVENRLEGDKTPTDVFVLGKFTVDELAVLRQSFSDARKLLLESVTSEN
jgi:PTH1 family peptidyl-tRNA hydrolase